MVKVDESDALASQSRTWRQVWRSSSLDCRMKPYQYLAAVVVDPHKATFKQSLLEDLLVGDRRT